MSRLEKIEQKLSVLKPQYLEIIDNSSDHNNHIGSPKTGESHFTINIYADSISSEELIKQHKIIKNLLRTEFTNGLHALSITIIKK